MNFIRLTSRSARFCGVLAIASGVVFAVAPAAFSHTFLGVHAMTAAIAASFMFTLGVALLVFHSPSPKTINTGP